jgi:hypothetical protein
MVFKKIAMVTTDCTTIVTIYRANTGYCPTHSGPTNKCGGTLRKQAGKITTISMY